MGRMSPQPPARSVGERWPVGELLPGPCCTLRCVSPVGQSPGGNSPLSPAAPRQEEGSKRSRGLPAAGLQQQQRSGAAGCSGAAAQKGSAAPAAGGAQPSPTSLGTPGVWGSMPALWALGRGGAAGGWRGGWEDAGARLCQGRVSDRSLCFPLGDMGPPLLCAPQAPPPLSWIPPTAPGRGTPSPIATPHSRGTPPQPHAAPSNKGTPHPSLPLPNTPQTHGPFCAPLPAPH